MANIKVLSILGFILAALPTISLAQTQNFPAGPITVVVPYQAGGATDIVVRPLVEGAKKFLGQPIVVENRTGGGGAVGVGRIVGK